MAHALTYIDTGNPHWMTALLFVLADATAIALLRNCSRCPLQRLQPVAQRNS